MTDVWRLNSTQASIYDNEARDNNQGLYVGDSDDLDRSQVYAHFSHENNNHGFYLDNNIEAYNNGATLHDGSGFFLNIGSDNTIVRDSCPIKDIFRLSAPTATPADAGTPNLAQAGVNPLSARSPLAAVAHAQPGGEEGRLELPGLGSGLASQAGRESGAPRSAAPPMSLPSAALPASLLGRMAANESNHGWRLVSWGGRLKPNFPGWSLELHGGLERAGVVLSARDSDRPQLTVWGWLRLGRSLPAVVFGRGVKTRS